MDAIEDAIMDLTTERTRIDLKLRVLEEARKVLSAVYEPLGTVPSVEQFIDATDVGITDAVRGAYRHNADRTLGAGDIAEIIKASGFNLAKYKNQMSVIHQVISRLVESGELTPMDLSSGEKAYQWNLKDAAERISAGKFGSGTLQSLTGTSPISRLRGINKTDKK